MLTTWITGSVAAVGAGRAADLPCSGRSTSATRTITESEQEPEPTLLLVADPDPILLQALSVALLDLGVGRVLPLGGVAGVDQVLTDGIVGDLALIGLGFGSPAFRLIAELRAAGWPRVITLVPTTDPGPLLDAVRAGATGVLRCPPGTPVHHPDPGPVPKLSAREVDILRLVADGRSNKWIGQRLAVSPLTVKNHLARIARKFGHGSREEMVAAALRGGIIE